MSTLTLRLPHSLHRKLREVAEREGISINQLITVEFGGRASAIVHMRREFVSRVFTVLSPQTHNLQIARLIHQSDDARANDPTLGGLLPAATSGAPVGPRDS
jgi:predicted DNA-binding ribbon-helix-helix protein